MGNAVADVLIRAMVEEGQLSESANMLRILEELDLGLRAFPYNFIIQVCLRIHLRSLCALLCFWD